MEALPHGLNNNFNFLKSIIKLFYDNWLTYFDGFSDIWIIGGDGTFNYFTNHYPYCQLPTSIFKGGSGDDFAWKLYGDVTLEQQLQILLSPQPRFVDAGRFNGKLFINCLGIGFDRQRSIAINKCYSLYRRSSWLFADCNSKNIDV